MKLITINHKVAVLRIHTNKDDFYFSYVIVEKKGEELEVVEKDNAIYFSIGELYEKLNKLPVVLLFTGTELLYTSENSLLNFSKEEFYTSSYESSNDLIFEALIRATIVDDYVESLLNNNINIIDVVVGVFSYCLLYGQAYETKEVFIDNLLIQFDDEDCKNIKRKLDKEKETVAIKEGIGLAVVYEHFFSSGQIKTTYNNDVVIFNKAELKEKKQFELIGKIGIITLFMILTIAYVLGTVFISKNEKNSVVLTQAKLKQRQYENMLAEETKRKEILNFSGFYKDKYLVDYINEIVKRMPQTILLNEINVFPKDSQMNKKKKIQINENLLVISGELTKDEEFNKWVFRLKKQLKAYKIDIVEYTKVKDKTKFKLNILLQ